MVTLCVCVRLLCVDARDYACTHASTYRYVYVHELAAGTRTCMRRLQTCNTRKVIMPQLGCTHCPALRYTQASIPTSLPTSMHDIACAKLSYLKKSTGKNITVHIPQHTALYYGVSVCSRPMKMPPAALQCKRIACKCPKTSGYL